MIPRYSRPEMARLWTPENRYQGWLRVELAAANAMAEAGLVPREAGLECERQAPVFTPKDAERIDEIEKAPRHDVIAFLTFLEERIGPAARHLHFGMTSSDVLDTSLAMLLREAGDLLLAGIDRAREAVVRRAEEHRRTPCIGRSHGIHAEPTTFGWKLAVWADELQRARRRIEKEREGIAYGKISGAVGTFAHLSPQIEEAALASLGLKAAPASTQVISRDRHAEMLNALAVCASSLDRFATEIRHLARTEVREVEEPFRTGMKGSSAMPHKRNPKVAERISGLARVVRGAALVGLENMPLWHERDISHSSAERIVIPDAFLALDYMLDRFTWILDGLVVYPERMERNLWASHGLFFSHRLLLALVEAGLERADAYRLVARNAMSAWGEERDFGELVRGDPEIRSALDERGLASVFDLDSTIANLDSTFDRLRRLAPKEEPVHV